VQAIFQVTTPAVGRFDFVVTYDRPVILGRGSAATVRIDDPGLSRRHCRVSLTPQGLLIQDLDSSNGSFVNGQKISTQYLRPGDEISIGQTIMRPFPGGGPPAGPQPAAYAPSPMNHAPSQPTGYASRGISSEISSGNYRAQAPMGMPAPMPGQMIGAMPNQGMPGMGMAPRMSGEINPGSYGVHPQMTMGSMPNMGKQGMPAQPMGAPQMPRNPYPSQGMGPPMGAPMGGMAQMNPGMHQPSPFNQQPASMPVPATLDPKMIQCSRCGSSFEGTRAQVHWRDRNGDPSLLVCEKCKDRERMAGDQVHGYELLDVLGKGAMGIVYKARKQATGEIIALKIVSLEGDPNGFQNFLREAQTGARVDHPNSVRTMEMGNSSGKFYIAMEFVQGRTLEDIIKDRGSLDQHTIMNMAYVLLDVLEAARKVNVVHRDLKPANILVTANFEPKVTDFGLAKLITNAGKSGLTAPGDIRGTPMFMPPEQLENAAMVDHRADLYSLGATLYNGLTNTYPFKVKTLRDLCMALEKDEPTPVCEHNRNISPHLSNFIQKLMEKKPAERFQTASDAQVELRKAREMILAGQ
jgi:hypothetical protein